MKISMVQDEKNRQEEKDKKARKIKIGATSAAMAVVIAVGIGATWLSVSGDKETQTTTQAKTIPGFKSKEESANEANKILSKSEVFAMNGGSSQNKETSEENESSENSDNSDSSESYKLDPKIVLQDVINSNNYPKDENGNIIDSEYTMPEEVIDEYARNIVNNSQTKPGVYEIPGAGIVSVGDGDGEADFDQIKKNLEELNKTMEPDAKPGSLPRNPTISADENIVASMVQADLLRINDYIRSGSGADGRDVISVIRGNEITTGSRFGIDDPLYGVNSNRTWRDAAKALGTAAYYNSNYFSIAKGGFSGELENYMMNGLFDVDWTKATNYSVEAIDADSDDSLKVYKSHFQNAIVKFFVNGKIYTCHVLEGSQGYKVIDVDIE